MATFFQSFRSSDLPKRLLRYALSRLELLDTEALDIEKLDFALGRSTVLEFRDVGIKLQKLERLLKLPTSFQLQKAKILSLRITIPAAFYSNPIVIEVQGVQVKIRIASKDDNRNKRRKPQASKSAAEEDADDDEIVPHAIDLAQSFLEAQPQREKAELQAALEAESHDLAASVTSSEDGSEDDYPLGTGQALSLPTFLAGFLQGMVDRTQVTIQNVAFQLDVEVPVEPNSTVPDLVTFELAVDGIDIEGVTTQAPATQELEEQPAIISKEGKRHVSLNRIRACLISEANVFSTLARTPSIPSSVSASSPVMTSRQPLSRESTFQSRLPARDILTQAGEDDDEEAHDPMMDSEDAFNIPYDFSNSLDDQEEEEEARSAPSTPRALAPHDDANLDASMHSALSTADVPQEMWASFDQGTTDETVPAEPSPWGETSGTLETPHDDEPDSTDATKESSPSPKEELIQSQVFSHEDAQSMYMSAFSETPGAASETRQAMPGSWGSAPPSPESSPKSKKQTTDEQNAKQSASQYLGTKNEQETEAEKSTSHLAQLEPLDPEESIASLRSALAASEQRQRVTEEAAAAQEAGISDDIATPKGPTRLVKEIVTLKSISLYIPSGHEHVQVASSGEDLVASQLSTQAYSHLGRSISPNIPGAFSVHGGLQSSSLDARLEQSEQLQPPSVQQPADKHIEVHLAPLDVQFDASIGFLLAMVVSRILAALGEQETPSGASQKPAKPDESKPSAFPDLKIVAERISLHFLETLAGIADTPERVLSNLANNLGPDALLTTELQNLAVGITSANSSINTTVELEKFRFGYGNDDIISFDQRLQMRASVRDAFPPGGSDVSIKINQSRGSTRCDIKTLPLHVKLDLQRLDETFSWFGGLSSFLNMSSSVTSSASPKPKSPTTSKKPRGVRFDAPISPDDKSASSENKMDMRLGGFHLDLIGKECSLGIDTSAVKLVSREEGIGLGITKIQLAGPFIGDSPEQPPINVDITNTRIEYLISPKDNDLERLLELITPSKYKFDENDDEIMVDTLLRQRRKGAVLRLTFDNTDVQLGNLAQFKYLPALGEEIARLSTVAKYLPEDDRPGILTLALARNVDVSVNVGGKIGSVQTSLKDLEAGHITVPSLVAVGVNSISVRRNISEELIASVKPTIGAASQGPVLTMRMIGDDMEPVIKLRMRHLSFDYRVPTIMDILGLAEDATPQDFEESLAASVANLGEQAHTAITGKQPLPSQPTLAAKSAAGKPTKVDIVFRDCLLGLNPLGLTSKMVIVLTDTHLEVSLSNGDNVKALGHINKASILLINDVSLLDSKPTPAAARRRESNAMTPQVAGLCSQGYVDICYISSARATVKVTSSKQDGKKLLDIELRDDLLVLETCADSTQTLILLANSLAPPTPPSKEIKYRTEVVPVQDLLASISADAFGKAEGDYNFDNDFALAQELGIEDEDILSLDYSSQSSSLNVDSQYYGEVPVDDQLEDPSASAVSERTTSQDTNDGVLLTNFSSQPDDLLDDDEELVIQDNYFGSDSVVQGTAHRWISSKNAYDEANDDKVQRSPVSVRVRDVHVIWNLFDGYDWDHTREVISKAVNDLETKAYERRTRSEGRSDHDIEFEEEETVIGDFLFNSIYIGIPANRDPQELAQAINQELNDNATETESVATTSLTATPSRVGGSHRPRRKLKLNRSKRHKITFELQGINVDLVTFPPGSGETQSSVDVRIRDLDIFDHVPTSTWKKFATYDQDAGEREMGTSMVHLEILNVKPIPDLAASEIVLKATLLPLRLHVDQDALDFITRFFEFKDDSAQPTSSSPSDVPFVQRAEINAVPVKLDFKPKRVDYAGLRSGHTTEFMNFLILDEARMVLRHTIIYGVRGFDRLGKTLNDIWMPDIRRNQLPGILAGLAPVRSLVNVGSGIRDLVEIPIREYKKDGRIVRSIGKGAAAFAKTTGTEIVKLGAKVAVGTQYVLQGAEEMLAKQPNSGEGGWDDDDLDTEETKQISLYADQPTGVIQGLRGAYSSLARDLNIARDAIIAVPGEVMESQSAQGAAKAVLKRAPTIIFRPLIGSSKAIGQTLMGATNSLDPQNRRRVEEKYKRH